MSKAIKIGSLGSGTGRSPCRLCRGAGYILHKGKTGPEKRPCPHCGGGKKDGLRTK